ncbi:CPBP family intramembrane glutamic endopeptidase [Pararhodonellum marinum]|uniref:CPBP family intramembrane glutamic endopeptidase n=1 Tax=Pararhodonellum marinum TaxID=2755358 RepID=UPI001890146F|nr:type II CAAX endopeptidase family protein [Pararhodonellum marinum]
MDSDNINSKPIPVRFFVITFLWSWLLWLPFVLGGVGIWNWNESLRGSLSMPAILLGAFGPGIGAIYSIRTLQGKSFVRPFLKSFLSIKFGWKVWLIILGAMGIANFLAWYLPGFFGYERLPMLLPTIYVFPVYWLLMIFFGGGQEEIGWRGYIMPYLESKFGLWYGNTILGLIWAFWHLPLWAIPDSFQVFMPFPAFLIGCIGLSFFLSWVVKASKNKPMSALVAHGTSNAFLPIFPSLVMSTEVFQFHFWLLEFLVFGIGIMALLFMKIKNPSTPYP